MSEESPFPEAETAGRIVRRDTPPQTSSRRAVKYFLNTQHSAEGPMEGVLHLLGVLAILCVGASAMPSARMVNDTTSAVLFFTKFGYMDPKLLSPWSSALLSDDVFRNTIIDFQAFVGLDQTGELDNNTLTMMNTPRCGVKDKHGFGVSARRKRFALHKTSWGNTTLTYRITKYSKKLPSDDVDREIAAAFQMWQDVTDLTFIRQLKGNVDIEIRFERGDHGDSSPFDGKGGVLAHASYPRNGDAHFDEDETWTTRSYEGINLFQVAGHEFGHSLGLAHSMVRNSLMYPYYSDYQPNFKLHQDDINGIQALYGKPTTRSQGIQRQGSV